MTVQELIDKLAEVKDKSVLVKIQYTEYHGCPNGTCDGWSEGAEVDISTASNLETRFVVATDEDH